MKKPIAILLSLALVVAFGTAALAGSAKVRQITGEITGIDTKANRVTITKKNKEVVINIIDRTKIILCKGQKTIVDLKTGDKVTAKYTEADGTAKSITIRDD